MFTTSHRRTSSTAQSTIRLRSLPSLVVALVLGLLAFPHASWAQVGAGNINFCTILEESPQTSGARSAVIDTATANGSWESQSRIIQSFNGDTLTQLTFEERDAGTWRDTARATPEYDSSDRLERCTVEFKQDGTYVNAFRANLQYDNGNLDTQLNEVWDSTDANPNGEWVNLSRSTFEYDGSGNDTLQVDENWNPSTQQWINFQRFHRMYDSQARITLERQETWLGTWENSRRTQYTYNSSETVELEETWDGSSWVDDERRTITLNNDDLPTQALTEDWTGSDWVNDERDTFTYTTFENTQKFERVVNEVWNASASEWDDDTRTRFSYDSIIPVELARFEAQRAGNGAVQLTWQTASETTNSGFEGQRQTGVSSPWTDVRFIEGAGTTSDPQSYRFTDRAVPYTAATVRYRLKQVDLAGTAELSKTVEVRLGTPQRLALQAPFPNPAQNEATIRYELPEATEVQIVVYDLLGRRVATLVDGQKNAGRVQIPFRTQQLPSGTYMLRLQAADQIRTQRLTVVK